MEDRNPRHPYQASMEDLNPHHPYQASMEDLNPHHPYQASMEDSNPHHPYQASMEDSNPRHPYQASMEDSNPHHPYQASMEDSNSHHPYQASMEDSNPHHPYQASMEDSNPHHPYQACMEDSNPHHPYQASMEDSNPHHPYQASMEDRNPHHPYQASPQKALPLKKRSRSLADPERRDSRMDTPSPSRGSHGNSKGSEGGEGEVTVGEAERLRSKLRLKGKTFLLAIANIELRRDVHRKIEGLGGGVKKSRVDGRLYAVITDLKLDKVHRHCWALDLTDKDTVLAAAGTRRAPGTRAQGTDGGGEEPREEGRGGRREEGGGGPAENPPPAAKPLPTLQLSKLPPSRGRDMLKAAQQRKKNQQQQQQQQQHHQHQQGHQPPREGTPRAVTGQGPLSLSSHRSPAVDSQQDRPTGGRDRQVSLSSSKSAPDPPPLAADSSHRPPGIPNPPSDRTSPGHLPPEPSVATEQRSSSPAGQDPEAMTGSPTPREYKMCLHSEKEQREKVEEAECRGLEVLDANTFLQEVNPMYREVRRARMGISEKVTEGVYLQVFRDNQRIAIRVEHVSGVYRPTHQTFNKYPRDKLKLPYNPPPKSGPSPPLPHPPPPPPPPLQPPPPLSPRRPIPSLQLPIRVGSPGNEIILVPRREANERGDHQNSPQMTRFGGDQACRVEVSHAIANIPLHHNAKDRAGTKGESLERNVHGGVFRSTGQQCLIGNIPSRLEPLDKVKLSLTDMKPFRSLLRQQQNDVSGHEQTGQGPAAEDHKYACTEAKFRRVEKHYCELCREDYHSSILEHVQQAKHVQRVLDPDLFADLDAMLTYFPSFDAFLHLLLSPVRLYFIQRRRQPSTPTTSTYTTAANDNKSRNITNTITATTTTPIATIRTAGGNNSAGSNSNTRTTPTSKTESRDSGNPSTAQPQSQDQRASQQLSLRAGHVHVQEMDRSTPSGRPDSGRKAIMKTGERQDSHGITTQRQVGRAGQQSLSLVQGDEEKENHPPDTHEPSGNAATVASRTKKRQSSGGCVATLTPCQVQQDHRQLSTETVPADKEEGKNPPHKDHCSSRGVSVPVSAKEGDVSGDKIPTKTQYQQASKELTLPEQPVQDEEEKKNSPDTSSHMEVDEPDTDGHAIPSTSFKAQTPADTPTDSGKTPANTPTDSGKIPADTQNPSKTKDNRSPDDESGRDSSPLSAFTADEMADDERDEEETETASPSGHSQCLAFSDRPSSGDLDEQKNEGRPPPSSPRLHQRPPGVSPHPQSQSLEKYGGHSDPPTHRASHHARRHGPAQPEKRTPRKSKGDKPHATSPAGFSGKLRSSHTPRRSRRKRSTVNYMEHTSPDVPSEEESEQMRVPPIYLQLVSATTANVARRSRRKRLWRVSAQSQQQDQHREAASTSGRRREKKTRYASGRAYQGEEREIPGQHRHCGEGSGVGQSPPTLRDRRTQRTLGMRTFTDPRAAGSSTETADECPEENLSTGFHRPQAKPSPARETEKQCDVEDDHERPLSAESVPPYPHQEPSPQSGDGENEATQQWESFSETRDPQGQGSTNKKPKRSQSPVKTATASEVSPRFCVPIVQQNTDGRVAQHGRQPTGNTGVSSLRQPTGNTGVSSPQQPTGNTGVLSPRQPTGNTGVLSPRQPTGNTGVLSPRQPTGNTGALSPRQPTGNTGVSSPRQPTGNTGASSPRQPTGNTGVSSPPQTRRAVARKRAVLYREVGECVGAAAAPTFIPIIRESPESSTCYPGEQQSLQQTENNTLRVRPTQEKQRKVDTKSLEKEEAGCSPNVSDRSLVMNRTRKHATKSTMEEKKEITERAESHGSNDGGGGKNSPTSPQSCHGASQGGKPSSGKPSRCPNPVSITENQQRGATLSRQSALSRKPFSVTENQQGDTTLWTHSDSTHNPLSVPRNRQEGATPSARSPPATDQPGTSASSEALSLPTPAPEVDSLRRGVLDMDLNCRRLRRKQRSRSSRSSRASSSSRGSKKNYRPPTGEEVRLVADLAASFSGLCTLSAKTAERESDSKGHGDGGGGGGNDDGGCDGGSGGGCDDGDEEQDGEEKAP